MGRGPERREHGLTERPVERRCRFGRGFRQLKFGVTEVYCGLMKTMTVSEAETGFARLLGWLASGEEVEITEHQQPVAKRQGSWACLGIGGCGSTQQLAQFFPQS